MKKYEKMEMTIVSLNNKNLLCSLAGWLEQGDNNVYADAGITTYQIES